MNNTILSRVAALVASLVITLALFQSVALMGYPASESQMLIAQIAPAAMLADEVRP